MKQAVAPGPSWTPELALEPQSAVPAAFSTFLDQVDDLSLTRAVVTDEGWAVLAVESTLLVWDATSGDPSAPASGRTYRFQLTQALAAGAGSSFADRVALLVSPQV